MKITTKRHNINTQTHILLHIYVFIAYFIRLPYLFSLFKYKFYSTIICTYVDSFFLYCIMLLKSPLLILQSKSYVHSMHIYIYIYSHHKKNLKISVFVLLFHFVLCKFKKRKIFFFIVMFTLSSDQLRGNIYITIEG